MYAEFNSVYEIPSFCKGSEMYEKLFRPLSNVILRMNGTFI
jgi:hypothetical protein